MNIVFPFVTLPIAIGITTRFFVESRKSKVREKVVYGQGGFRNMPEEFNLR